MRSTRRVLGTGFGRGFAIMLVFLLSLCLVPSAAAAPQSQALQFNRFSPLAAKWWQWALEQPASISPLTDPSGTRCAEGQRGRMWFLAGPVPDSGPIAERTCIVPSGKTLFFPLVNAFSGWTDGDPEEARTASAQRDIVATYDVENATNLSVAVDGSSPNGLIQYEDSVPFRLTLPADNLFGLPAGTLVYPTVDAGHYALLDPLPSGAHELHFTGTLPSGFSVDVTYHLIVEE